MKILKVIAWRFRDLLFNIKIFTTVGLIKYYGALLSGKKLLHASIKGVEQKILIRVNNKIDRNVLEYVFFQKYHLPPVEKPIKDGAIILDFGSNIGCTLVDFKLRYPTSKVYGYEMHPNNFEMARANTKGLSNVSVFNKAVWVSNGNVSFSKKNLTDAFAISKELVADDDSIQIPSTSILEILQTNQLPVVDFLKMDIEGAELDIFDYTDVSWLTKVMSMNIEFHNINDSQLKKYIVLLENNGFTVYKSPNHWLSLLAYKS